MAAGDVYYVSGNLIGRKAFAFPQAVSDDYILVDNAAIALVASNVVAGTITAWINMPNITGTFTIVGSGDNNAVEFLDFYVQAGLLTCDCNVATTLQFDTQADQIDFKAHRWYHVAVTQRSGGSGVELFVNGKLINRTNDTSTDVDAWFDETTAIDTMRIGASNRAGNASVTQDFLGAISDVKIFDVPLSAAQVKDDFNGVTNTTNLHNHWDMDDDLIDQGSGLDDGTSTGADGILTNNYSEFTSRLKYIAILPLAAEFSFSTSGNFGYAIFIDAA